MSHYIHTALASSPCVYTI